MPVDESSGITTARFTMPESQRRFSEKLCGNAPARPRANVPVLRGSGALRQLPREEWAAGSCPYCGLSSAPCPTRGEPAPNTFTSFEALNA